jgi:hypothetical protein
VIERALDDPAAVQGLDPDAPIRRHDPYPENPNGLDNAWNVPTAGAVSGRTVSASGGGAVEPAWWTCPDLQSESSAFDPVAWTGIEMLDPQEHVSAITLPSAGGIGLSGGSDDMEISGRNSSTAG